MRTAIKDTAWSSVTEKSYTYHTVVYKMNLPAPRRNIKPKKFKLSDIPEGKIFDNIDEADPEYLAKLLLFKDETNNPDVELFVRKFIISNAGKLSYLSEPGNSLYTLSFDNIMYVRYCADWGPAKTVLRTMPEDIALKYIREGDVRGKAALYDIEVLSDRNDNAGLEAVKLIVKDRFSSKKKIVELDSITNKLDYLVKLDKICKNSNSSKLQYSYQRYTMSSYFLKMLGELSFSLAEEDNLLDIPYKNWKYILNKGDLYAQRSAATCMPTRMAYRYWLENIAGQAKEKFRTKNKISVIINAYLNRQDRISAIVKEELNG